MRNEIKIKFKDPEYFVNEEKGIVVCNLHYYVDYPRDLAKVFYWTVDTSPVRGVCKAVAKLGEGETFDLNVGKKVSLAKAEQKAYNKVFKYCLKAINNCAGMIEKLHNFAEKAVRVIDHNEEYISKF